MDAKLVNALSAIIEVEDARSRWEAAQADIRAARGDEILQAIVALTGGELRLRTVRRADSGPAGRVCGELSAPADADGELVGKVAELLGDCDGWLLAGHCADTRGGILRMWRPASIAAPDAEPLSDVERERLTHRLMHSMLPFAAREGALRRRAWRELVETRRRSGEAVAEAWPELCRWAAVSWWDVIWRHGEPSLLFTVGPGPVGASGRGHRSGDERPPRRRELVALGRAGALLPLAVHSPQDAALWHWSPALPAPAALCGADRDRYERIPAWMRHVHAHVDPAAPDWPWRPDGTQTYERRCECGTVYACTKHAYGGDTRAHDRVCPTCTARLWLGFPEQRAYGVELGAAPDAGDAGRRHPCSESPGWSDAILFAGTRCMALDAHWRIDDIKSKYGTLSFYASAHHAGLSELVDWCEDVSDTLCERCGAGAVTRDGGWVLTLCDACAGGPAPVPACGVIIT